MTKNSNFFFKDIVSEMHQGINTAADKVEYADEGMPIIQSKHFTSGKLELKGAKFLSSKDVDKYGDKYKPEKGDILFSNIGTVGKSIVIHDDYEFMFAWNVFLIKPKRKLVISHYFQYYLDYLLKKNSYQRWFTGGTVKFLNKKTIGNFKIPLPPLPEQQKIAAILDAADKLRQKDQQLIEQYNALSQSLFLDMFGDPVTNPMELNNNFELGRSIRLIGGGTPSKDVEEYWNGEISWASVKDLKSDILDKTVDSITQLGVDNSATRVVPRGSLIIATRMAVGKVAICTKYLAINQDLKAVEIIGDVNIFYLLYFFKSKKRYFESIASGATVKGLKIEHITKLKVTLPELNLQNQFAERIQAIENQKQQAQASLKKSDNLFNSLLQRAFKGELT